MVQKMVFKFFLSVISLLLIASNAMAVNEDHLNTVQKVYLAYYLRPADPGGLFWWANQLDQTGGDMSAMIDLFADSEESLRLWGQIDSGNIGQLIDSVYQALFHRDPDAGGRQFYVDGFNSGQFSPGSIVLNILYGARNQDAAAIENKLQYCNLFVSILDPDGDYLGPYEATYNADDEQAARDLLAAVTWDSVNISEQQVRYDIIDFIANPYDPIKVSACIKLPAPRNLDIDVMSAGEILLSWDKVEDAFYYTLYQDGNEIGTSVFSTDNYSIDGLSADRQYCFQVRANAGFGYEDSDLSESKCVTPGNSPVAAMLMGTWKGVGSDLHGFTMGTADTTIIFYEDGTWIAQQDLVINGLVSYGTVKGFISNGSYILDGSGKNIIGEGKGANADCDISFSFTLENLGILGDYQMGLVGEWDGYYLHEVRFDALMNQLIKEEE